MFIQVYLAPKVITEVSGPLLFLLYMNDLPDAVKNINVAMFPDDTSLSKSFRNNGELNG